MKIINLVLVGIAFLLFNSCIKDPIDPIDQTDPDVIDLDQSIQDLYDASSLAGFAVSVIKDDKVAFQKSYGFANVAEQKEYTNRTTQPIASTSKTFIAAAIIKAIDQGHFNLETEINDVLPFDVINPHSPNLPIKIKHLVSHTSGLIDEPIAYNEESYFLLSGELENLTLGMQGLVEGSGIKEGEQIPLAEFLASYYTPGESWYDENNFGEYSAGDSYEYSNIASALTAYLVEVKSGMLYKDYVKKYIFDPLEMTNSAFLQDELVAPTAATLYLNKIDFYPKYSFQAYPDGLVNTCNEDLAKYLLEMIRGKEGKGTILSNEGYQLLYRSNELPGNQGFAHSVFWDHRDNRIEHTGGDFGTTTIASFDPIQKTGFTFQMNMDFGGMNGDIVLNKFEELVNLLKDFEKK